MTVLLVTGAAGFIGSAVCRALAADQDVRVVGIDKMSYASSREALAACPKDRFELVEADITDARTLRALFLKHQFDGVMHLAAETHVDRSIDSPAAFIQSNIVGSFVLLETTRLYLSELSRERRAAFRLLHVSTDEVYGALGETGAFTEDMPYAPNSPYAASKASADFLARAWGNTYGLPIVISNCSNNYGPFQFPEKLIPLTLAKALAGERIPIYGRGQNVRDWLFVEDHALALITLLRHGRIGEKYNIGGAAEARNIDLVKTLCGILDQMAPADLPRPFDKLISFVADRPGHDARYAMDFSKLAGELGWAPRVTLEEGLTRTVRWYLDNQDWCATMNARYQGQRLGLTAKTDQA